MNERLHELMGKTLDKKFSYTWSTMNYDDLQVYTEHLAELIIRECAGVCEYRYSHNHKDNSEGAFEAIACSDAIKEHFGDLS